MRTLAAGREASQLQTYACTLWLRRVWTTVTAPNGNIKGSRFVVVAVNQMIRELLDRAEDRHRIRLRKRGRVGHEELAMAVIREQMSMSDRATLKAGPTKRNQRVNKSMEKHTRRSQSALHLRT
jgi:hypothetical protein